MAVCYDLRFPELFRCLFNRKAEIIALPAAFTFPTGKAHWEVLCRSRAIENFCYFIGAGQVGGEKETYGHSLIVDPWGNVLCSLENGMGVITADINLAHLRKIREKMPVQQHQRIFSTINY